MSVKLMWSAMTVKAGSPTAKLILLKLADNANDKGECWPSLKNIAEHCEVSQKTVITNIKKLEDLGYVKKINRFNDKGKTSNLYVITITEGAPVEGNSSSEPCEKTSTTHVKKRKEPSEKTSTTPYEKTSTTPYEKSSHESVSIEPVITESVIETIEREKIVSLESLNAFVSYRKKIKKPMTTHAVELLVAKLGGLRVDGHSPQELINDAIMNGWQSVYPKTSAQTNRTYQSHQERIREENIRVMSNWANKE